jgi:hypothetical protein
MSRTTPPHLETTLTWKMAPPSQRQLSQSLDGAPALKTVSSTQRRRHHPRDDTALKTAPSPLEDDTSDLEGGIPTLKTAAPS